MKKLFLYICIISIYFTLVACNNKTENTLTTDDVKVTSELPNSIETELSEQQAFELSAETIYEASEYGEIQEYGGEFYFDENTKGYYYNLECFYLNSDFLSSTINILNIFIPPISSLCSFYHPNVSVLFPYYHFEVFL